jgi:anti-sigma28 factor (negative regulator of flagellin synthesis)
MKIDDFLDKALATGSNMTRKSKPVGKHQPEKAAPTTPDKLPKEVKSETAINYVDKYESSQEPSESAMRRGSSPSQDPVPVRKDRVERAKQLVAAGAYDSQDVTDKIIDRLLETIREA